jgi:hypothetical protein
MEDKFIHFGCWNNANVKSKDGKEKSIGCVEPVMNMLKNYLDRTAEKPNFMVIAGDNYYPDKTMLNDKKVKIIYPNKMIHGFNLLPDSLPIHMILGNHDLETNGKKQSLFIENVDAPENNDCAIIQYEKNIMRSKPNIEYKLFDSKYLKNNTLLLMIDTSMYTDDVEKYMPCYNEFLGTTFRTSQDLINYQNREIYESINRYSGRINNLIIIGHHPISGYKFKEEKNEEGNIIPAHIELINDIIKFNIVLKEIYRIAGRDAINYYYLCADLHMYQEGKIALNVDVNSNMNMNIAQYIVGTGGAKLDDKIPPDMELPTMDGITYTMGRVEYDCGFLECKIEDNELIFTPILLNNRISGGRKTRKNKKFKKSNRTKRTKRTKKSRKGRK